MRGLKILISRVRYITFDDILGVIVFLFLYPISLIAALYFKMIHKKIWIISENGDCMTACDNGFNFFEYLNSNHFDNVYFAINKKSPYLDKLKKYKDKVVIRGSFRHWIYYLCADKRISTHTLSAPSMGIFYVFQKLGIKCHKTIFLQHGIIYNDHPSLYYENCKIDLFICGAKKEYDYIREKFHYPKTIVKYTGLARFDKLHNTDTIQNQILVMPTWRRWISMDIQNDDDFVKTDYYKMYQGLIDDERLNKFLRDRDIRMKVFFHQSMDRFEKYFKSNSEYICIAKKEENNIQQLLRESQLMVTDYSSVFFDFAYMKKPIIYFQFDNEMFRTFHYEEGYFSYANDAFGPICTDIKTVVDNIIDISNNSMLMKKIYADRVDDFFVLNDDNNCHRILEAIKSMK